MKTEKYTDFFEEAEKSMSEDSIHRAEREANKIMLNLGLAELRKHAGHFKDRSEKRHELN
jgi:hypothetical protein